MSFVIAAPEALVAVASDLAGIGSALAEANAAALASASADPMPARSEATATNASGAAITNDIVYLRSIMHRPCRQGAQIVSLTRPPSTRFPMDRMHTIPLAAYALCMTQSMRLSKWL